jgi:hypothetical protein
LFRHIAPAWECNRPPHFRLHSKSHPQRFIYQNQTTIEKALAELNRIPPEED